MPDARRTLIPLAAAALALSAGTAVAAPDSAPAAGRPGGPTCALAGAEISATTRVAEELTELFTGYADSGAGWTGADSTYSAPLRDGSIAWIFSDTFLGPVEEDGTRPLSTPFLNNSIILQNGAELTTVTGGTPDARESIVGPTADGDWHWFGAGLATRRDGLHIGVLRFSRFGDGYWDWGWDSNAVVTLDTDTWEVTGLDPLPSAAGVQWASWYERVGGVVYVYGVEDLGAVKYMHVARVLGGDFTDLKRWWYWDGEGWSRQETDSVRIMPGVANEYSVTRYRDGYLLITQDTSVPFSSEIRAYTSCSPTGPFEGGATIYRMPEVGAAGTYGNTNVITYNAHEHPELRDGDTLIVTYNVNSMDTDDVYEDVTIYRPRFLEVELDLTRP